MGQKFPYSHRVEHIITDGDRRLIHRRIQLLLNDKGVAAEIQHRLKVGHIPFPRREEETPRALSMALCDFLEHTDGCALAFLVGHERAQSLESAL